MLKYNPQTQKNDQSYYFLNYFRNTSAVHPRHTNFQMTLPLYSETYMSLAECSATGLSKNRPPSENHNQKGKVDRKQTNK